MPTFRFALQGSALYGKKAGHGKHHGFGWTLFDFVGCSLVGNVELSEEGPLIAGTTSKIAPIAFGERAYYTSSNEDLCSFVASCGCQFGWQGSPDCEYAYPVFRTGPWKASLLCVVARPEDCQPECASSPHTGQMQNIGEGKPTLGATTYG